MGQSISTLVPWLCIAGPKRPLEGCHYFVANCLCGILCVHRTCQPYERQKDEVDVEAKGLEVSLTSCSTNQFGIRSAWIEKTRHDMSSSALQSLFVGRQQDRSLLHAEMLGDISFNKMQKSQRLKKLDLAPGSQRVHDHRMMESYKEGRLCLMERKPLAFNHTSPPPCGLHYPAFYLPSVRPLV